MPCHVMLWHVMRCHVMLLHVKWWHVISYDVMQYHFMQWSNHLCHVMLCHVMSCCVMSCHVMAWHGLSCHVMSCHVMSFHGMSCHFMSCHVILGWHSMPWQFASLTVKYLWTGFSCLIHSFKRFWHQLWMKTDRIGQLLSEKKCLFQLIYTKMKPFEWLRKVTRLLDFLGLIHAR